MRSVSANKQLGVKKISSKMKKHVMAARQNGWRRNGSGGGVSIMAASSKAASRLSRMA